MTETEEQILTHVLDTLIPPSADGKLPGAGQAGVVGHLKDVIQRNPEAWPSIAAGLATLHGSGFADLSPSEREEALRSLDRGHPGFVGSLVFHAYAGYYQSVPALQGLGLPARAPHPLGYEITENDLSLLDPVRAKPKLYR